MEDKNMTMPSLDSPELEVEETQVQETTEQKEEASEEQDAEKEPQWEVVEVKRDMSSRAFRGTEKEARDKFDVLIKAGTNKKLVLRDELGFERDQFTPAEPEGKGMTGMPIREVRVPLPKELMSHPVEPPSKGVAKKARWHAKDLAKRALGAIVRKVL